MSERQSAKPKKIGTQWWLAELDQYGNPELTDGAHSNRQGANKAMYLILGMHLSEPEKRYAVARVELFEAEPDSRGINHDALNTMAGVVSRYRSASHAD